MYTFSKNLENVYRFQIQNSVLFYISKNNNSLYFEVNKLFDDVKSFVIHPKFLIIRNSKMEILKYDLLSHKTTLLYFEYSFHQCRRFSRDTDGIPCWAKGLGNWE